MAIDARIPLGVVSPDIKTPNQAKAESYALRGAQLENARKENDATLGLLGGVTDQTTYDTARQKAKSMGLDTSSLPDAYDPKIVDQLTYSSLTAKERLDYELKKQELEIKANRAASGGIEYTGPDGTTLVISGDKPQHKQDVTDLSDARSAAESANSLGHTISRAADLFKNTETGPLEGYKNTGKAILAGINKNWVAPDSLAKASNFQELEGLSMEMGIAALQNLKGSASDRDLQLAIGSNLDVNQLPEANLNRFANKAAAIDLANAKPQFMERWTQKYGDTNKPNENGQTFSEVWQQYKDQNWKTMADKYRAQLAGKGEAADNGNGNPQLLAPPTAEQMGTAPQAPQAPKNGRNLQLPFVNGKIDPAQLKVNGIYAAPNGGSVVWDGQHFIEVN